MITLIAFAFVLGVLVFAHELGHFLLAKKVGVRVERFSLGYGPKLFGFRRGETEYILAAFPLGGYVKMTGENLDEEVHGDPWEFASRSVRERMQIVLCGPLMNIMLAFVLMTGVFMLGRSMPEYLTQIPVIGWVEEGSPAAKAGFKVGDRILSVSGQRANTWEQLLVTAAASDRNEPLKIEFERGERKMVAHISPRINEQGEMDALGFYHHIPPQVAGLTPGYPAEEAGLQEGDFINAIDGKPIHHWFQLSQIIHRSANQELELTVSRKYGPTKIKVTPRKDSLQGGIGLIGIRSPQKMVLRKYPLWQAISKSFEEVNTLLHLTLDFLKKLLLGRASPKSLGGPIVIAQIAGDAARSGSSDLLYFMSFLSLQLGILNLLPIPILDGGHLTFLTIEAILKRPMSLKKREIAQQIGLTFLLMLMVLVFYNDIMRWIGG